MTTVDASTPLDPKKPDIPPFTSRFRSYFVAGLITTLPIMATLWVLRFMFNLFRDASAWIVESALHTKPGLSFLGRFGVTPENWNQQGWDALSWIVAWPLSALCVVLTIFLIYATGIFARNLLGRRLIDLFERLVQRLPFLKSIYAASKKVVEAFGGEDRSAFLGVALVPFPDQSMRAVAFITGEFNDARTNERLVSVFIPTTPNPTTGYLQIMRSADIVRLPYSVEQAFTMIMSAGVMRPDSITIHPPSTPIPAMKESSRPEGEGR